DVEAGLRLGVVSEEDAARLADAVAAEAPVLAALELAEEVWTMTSLIGFEALMRGKRVTTVGAPFYAGWGLTRDRGAPPARRRARPSLDQLVHAALIDYPSYVDPVSGLPCAPEVIAERLAAGEGGPRLGGRMLSKLQGRLAPYAYLWR
ncbi:MAG: capsular polysaccharide biosynthesis protein, partial [Pseudomonadota bacterium]